jgi:hypothetical protein
MIRVRISDSAPFVAHTMPSPRFMVNDGEARLVSTPLADGTVVLVAPRPRGPALLWLMPGFYNKEEIARFKETAPERLTVPAVSAAATPRTYADLEAWKLARCRPKRGRRTERHDAMIDSAAPEAVVSNNPVYRLPFLIGALLLSTFAFAASVRTGPPTSEPPRIEAFTARAIRS